MNIKEIKQILELMKNSDITEIEIERRNERLKLRRGEPIKESQNNPKHIISENQPHALDESTKDETNLVTITSPFVGTFYRAPSPGAPPFVEEGASVEKGQTLCIIEAMKLMNEIEAELSGKLVSILVEDGKPVEYAQPLFTIEPT